MQVGDIKIKQGKEYECIYVSDDIIMFKLKKGS